MTIYIRTNDAAHPIVEYCDTCGQPDNCGDCDHTPVLCEHGLSLWLCMGPMHYPSRDDEMNGRYY